MQNCIFGFAVLEYEKDFFFLPEYLQGFSLYILLRIFRSQEIFRSWEVIIKKYAVIFDWQVIIPKL